MHPANLLLILMGMTIIEATIFKIPPLHLIHPQLVVISLIFIGLFRGPKLALVLGLLIGLIQDIVYGTFIGMDMFAMGVVGYFSAVTFRLFLHRHLILVVFSVIAYSAVYSLVSFGIAVLFAAAKVDFFAVIIQTIRMMVINGLFSLLLYVPAGKYIPERSGRNMADEEL